jgi:hypothetical protein
VLSLPRFAREYVAKQMREVREARAGHAENNAGMRLFSRPWLLSTISLPALLALLAAEPLASQVTWTNVPLVGGRTNPGMAYDLLRGVTVVFGNDPTYLRKTFLWDGTNWTEHPPQSGTHPRLRGAHVSMCYDLGRDRVVMFGQPGSGAVQTWEWDGSKWLQKTHKTSPPYSEALVYDAARGKTLLVGGSDTWQWDGSDWSKLTPVNRPPRRAFPNVAYDSWRKRIVLFGGDRVLNDTWEWDGKNWAKLAPKTSPPAGHTDYQMVYDSARRVCVLAGNGRTWEWNGKNWLKRTLAVYPPSLGQHGMTYDTRRRRVVMLGGRDKHGVSSEVWEFDGTKWQIAWGGDPADVGGHRLAYDSVRDRTVLFGGRRSWTPSTTNHTFEFDGVQWERKSPVASPFPSIRWDHAMAYDSSRKQVVMFGGRGASKPPFTWLWDGTNWVPRLPKNSPTTRDGHMMVYDSARQRIVLFGGDNSGGALTDTWEWDGRDWQNRKPIQSPPASCCGGGGMAYDAARKRSVLLAWRGSTSPPETWEWDGTNWQKRSPVTTPLKNLGRAMTYDGARQRVIITNRLETWEWDGTNWQKRKPQTTPSGQGGGAAVTYDSNRERVILYGGGRDMQEYGPTHPAAYTPFGRGCPSTGAPTLTNPIRYRPWLGEIFGVEVRGIPTGRSAVLLLGVSRSTWGSTPLPLDLTGIGMPGCSLLVSLDVVLPLQNIAGTAVFAARIPVDSKLLGLKFYNQAVVQDPRANALGLILSHAAEGRIGGK